jgi:hypothetical protein
MSMFHLVETSQLPESYDITLRGRKAGSCRGVLGEYLFVAECHGVTVHVSDIDGPARLSSEERPKQLRSACVAVLSALAAEGVVTDLYTVESCRPGASV